MEVKPGYRQTEVGVIPEDWSVSAIGEIATKVGSGITPTGGSKRYREYGRPFIRSQNVGWGSILLDDLAFIDEATHNEFPATEVRKNDVLLNITGASIGRTAIADERLVGGNVNQHVCIIRPDPAKAVPKLVNALLLSTLGQRQIDSFQAGGNRQGLNFAQTKSIKLPLPPTKAEQEAIAEALSDADALIETLEQLIVKKRNLKQGAMQELLTGKKRLPEFEKTTGYKKTEVGEIPEDWTVTTVGHEFSIQLGKMLDSEKNTGVAKPYLGNRAVQWGRIDLSEIGTIKLTPADLNRYRLIKGDLLVCEGGEIGRAAIWDRPLEECYYQKALHRLRPLHGYNIELMLGMLQRSAATGGLLNFVTQTSIAHLPKDKFEKVPIPRPPTRGEEEAIAAILSDMNAEIAALDAKLTKARHIKQAMTQELLTGKTRLT
jgi:type I restriction enzyme S subunit